MTVLDEIEAEIPALRRYARALVRDSDAADDLVQDCLERAIRRQRFWRAGPVRAWLFRILLNRFRDQRRRYGRAPQLVDAGSAVDLARPGGQEASLALREVHDALGRLPDDQRAALLLVALEGMTLAEAAAVLATNPNTVASRLARARAALRLMTGRAGAVGSAGKKETRGD